MSIFNIGSINVDTFLSLPRLPQEGDTLTVSKRERDIGGKGFNISVAISNAGGTVHHIGAIGDNDAYVEDQLARYGLETEGVHKSAVHPTGRAYVLLDREGGNCIALDAGANRAIPAAHIEACLQSAAPGDWLVVQNETNGIDQAITIAKRRGLKVALVAAPFDEELVASLLDQVDLISANEVEFRQIQSVLASRTVQTARPALAITYGSDRAEYIDGDALYSEKSHSVPVVNTTAAGDTFIGYLLASLDQGCPPNKALSIANAAAAIKVQRAGSASGIPTLEEVRAFMGEAL